FAFAWPQYSCGSSMLTVSLRAYVTGSVNQERLLRNEYLAAENRASMTMRGEPPPPRVRGDSGAGQPRRGEPRQGGYQGRGSLRGQCRRRSDQSDSPAALQQFFGPKGQALWEAF